MDETNLSRDEEQPVETAATAPEETLTPSEENAAVELLHDPKPPENLSLQDSEEDKQVFNSKTAQPGTIPTPEKIGAAFEKLNVKEGELDSSGANGQAPTPKVDVPPLNFDIKENKQKSDIFSLDEIDNAKNTNNIFSVKGTPSNRTYKRRDLTSNVFPAGCMGCREDAPGDQTGPSPRRFLDSHDAAKDYAGHMDSTPRKRPTSAKVDSTRNPLTGVGMEQEDARKQTNSRRKDGNPLLGLGYDNPEDTTTNSATRIPPGGYSQGLW